MNETAAEILRSHRIMAISTVRPDGWPQTTIVGYANDGPVIYFLIFRGSQKFANIAKDSRISFAVGDEPADIRLAKAVYAGAHASEITDPAERDRAWALLKRSHPNLIGSPIPDPSVAAFMRAECEHLTVLDYSKGLGHSDALHLASDE
ncbi:MAG TPA: pyridoxamine 5'-phosphate oxidase family protein [Sphingomicrobium sp.]|nr:pyridoxamine 5'-phosphate oxidase family protein [Sphingomicrobium sp.]